jgi:hypothetical protein
MSKPPEGLKNGHLTAWRLEQLEQRMEHLEEGIQAASRWLMGTLGALILSLILLVVNLVSSHWAQPVKP